LLLDTSVTSELVKPSPDENVVEWTKRADETSLYARLLRLR
jgi:predicted nucleic acid-binding protein